MPKPRKRVVLVALWLVAPACMILSMIGRTLAANRLAFAFKAALPSLAASAIPGLPRRCRLRHYADKNGKHRLVIEAYGYRWFRVGGLDYLLRRTDIDQPAKQSGA